MPVVPINYLAVLVCGVVAIVIGFLWYGPLFGKAWMRLAGMDKLTSEQMAMGKKKMPMMAAIQFVGALVMAGVLTHNLAYGEAYTHAMGVSAGLQAGFWSWLGFVVPTTMGAALWEGKPWKYWMIIAGDWLVTLLVMGVILALWQ